MTQKMIVEFEEGKRPKSGDEERAESLQKGRARLQKLSYKKKMAAPGETSSQRPSKFMGGDRNYE